MLMLKLLLQARGEGDIMMSDVERVRNQFEDGL